MLKVVDDVLMGCAEKMKCCKTHEHCKGLGRWSEVQGLKQVQPAISRHSPNDDVKTPDDSNAEKGCAR
jgi:hypothetical protein